MKEPELLFSTVAPVEISVRKTGLYTHNVATSIQTELLVGGHVVAKLATVMPPSVSDELTTLDLQCKCRAAADAMERELVERLAASLKAGINLIPSRAVRGNHDI